MNQEYVTVYEVSTQPTNWAFALAGVVPLIIGIAVFLGKQRFKWGRPHWLMPIFFCGFGLLWLCTAGISVLREDSQALAAYQKGDYWLVEGLVTDFIRCLTKDTKRNAFPFRTNASATPTTMSLPVFTIRHPPVVPFVQGYRSASSIRAA